MVLFRQNDKRRLVLREIKGFDFILVRSGLAVGLIGQFPHFDRASTQAIAHQTHSHGMGAKLASVHAVSPEIEAFKNLILPIIAVVRVESTNLEQYANSWC